jgi:hypothetical protein
VFPAAEIVAGIMLLLKATDIFPGCSSEMDSPLIVRLCRIISYSANCARPNKTGSSRQIKKRGDNELPLELGRIF